MFTSIFEIKIYEKNSLTPKNSFSIAGSWETFCQMTSYMKKLSKASTAACLNKNLLYLKKVIFTSVYVK